MLIHAFRRKTCLFFLFNLSSIFKWCWEIRHPHQGKFPSLTKNFSIDRSHHVTPYSNPPPPLTRKYPLKTSVCFQITNYLCKQWAKFITCSPSPEVRGDLFYFLCFSFFRYSVLFYFCVFLFFVIIYKSSRSNRINPSQILPFHNTKNISAAPNCKQTIWFVIFFVLFFFISLSYTSILDLVE